MLAEEAEAQFFRDRPQETLRGWLHEGFDAITATQAGRSLFDERHNPPYQIPVSHDAAKELIGFWRRRGEDGALVHDFRDDEWDTRFLGDPTRPSDTTTVPSDCARTSLATNGSPT